MGLGNQSFECDGPSFPLIAGELIRRSHANADQLFRDAEQRSPEFQRIALEYRFAGSRERRSRLHACQHAS